LTVKTQIVLSASMGFITSFACSLRFRDESFDTAVSKDEDTHPIRDVAVLTDMVSTCAFISVFGDVVVGTAEFEIIQMTRPITPAVLPATHLLYRQIILLETTNESFR